MTSEPDEYASFVEHPWFGQGPRFTGLDPSSSDDDVNLHWNTTAASEIVAQYEAVTGEVWPFIDFSEYCSRTTRIDNTAVVADLMRQTPATVPVTHYFDLERLCRDCERPFIFFAEEQKHWYEELGFGLNSDCIRCVECRKQQQNIARQRKLYESLCHVESGTEEQSIQMADACLSLIEVGVFTVRQTQRVRQLLNAISEGTRNRENSRLCELTARIAALASNE